MTGPVPSLPSPESHAPLCLPYSSCTGSFQFFKHPFLLFRGPTPFQVLASVTFLQRRLPWPPSLNTCPTPPFYSRSQHHAHFLHCVYFCNWIFICRLISFFFLFSCCHCATAMSRQRPCINDEELRNMNNLQYFEILGGMGWGLVRKGKEGGGRKLSISKL